MPRGDAFVSTGSELYQGLLVSMHAMAQPLTLLQSRLYLALEEAGGAEDSPLALAAEDLASVCAMFRLSQQLFYLESVPPRLVTTQIAEVVEALREDAEAVFAGSAISIAFAGKLQAKEAGKDGDADGSAGVTFSRPAKSVLVDPARTRVALSQILAVARECVPATSSLACDLRLSDRWAEFLVEVRPERTKSASQDRKAALDHAAVAGSATEVPSTESIPLSEMARLLLASARLALTTQQAELGFRASPLRLRVCLPLAPRGAAGLSR